MLRTRRSGVYCRPQNNSGKFSDMGMRFGAVKLPAVLLTVACLVGLSCGAARADVGPGGAVPSADPVGPPVLQNPGFECKVGYVTQEGIQRRVPLGWTGVLISGTPQLDSVRIRWGGGCDGSGWVEHLEGDDSLVFVAQDLETPPEPGKPFDAAVYQQVAVTPARPTVSADGWSAYVAAAPLPATVPRTITWRSCSASTRTGGTDPLAPKRDLGRRSAQLH